MLEKMQELIADQLSVDADSITEASSFKDDLGADSLDLYELIMALVRFSWCQCFRVQCICTNDERMTKERLG